MSRDSLGEFEQQVLLSILRRDGETYSVPIVLELEQRTGREVSQAAVYIVLRRLEDKGLVSSRMADGTDAETGKVRRYFKLEPAGLDRLRESRRALFALWDGFDHVLDDGS